MDDWTETLISPDTAIRDAMLAMSKSRKQIVLVVDENRRLLGTVTDGDIRRSILRSGSLDAPIREIMNPDPISTPPTTPRKVRLSVMREHHIHHLPVVDEESRVIDLLLLENLLLPSDQKEPNWVIILAGGQGHRLRPLTESVPKPLLPVGGRPILETIVANLAEHGFKHLYLSVNYKAEMVKKHFGDGERFGMEICYLEENRPLGTAGPLGLISRRHDAPLLVMNADLLTNLNFHNLLTYHAEHNACATVCVREFTMEVPYGVVELDHNRLLGINEKPVHTFMGNAGIYVLNPDIPPTIPRDRHLDMPDLLRRLIKDSNEVVGYPLHEYWIDIGRAEELRCAVSEFTTIFS